MLIGAGLGLTLCAALLLIFQPLIIQQAELRIYDLMLSGRISPPKTNIPVLVGIDEESLNSYGQWPWPRYRVAGLVERLHELGAKVIALDFLMPEPDRTSPEVILSERQRDREPSAKVPATESHDSNSLRLAGAISRAETALGFFVDFSGLRAFQLHDEPGIPAGMIVTLDPGSAAGLPNSAGIIRSLRVLTDAARAEGFTNAIHDGDGALRRVPLLLAFEG